MKTVLVIAGSDPTSGAGLEQDLRVLQVFGLHGIGVVTALTVQSSLRVEACSVIDPALFRRRLEVLLSDVSPAAVKCGMFADERFIEIAQDVRTRMGQHVPWIIDPVFVSSSGCQLLHESARPALLRLIRSGSSVITPNVREAELLLGGVCGLNGPDLCRRLANETGALTVLTGGDQRGACATDWICDGKRLMALSSRRHGSESPHGTGCAFATAVAAGLTHGKTPIQAAIDAKKFVLRAIKDAENFDHPELQDQRRRLILVFSKDQL